MFPHTALTDRRTQVESEISALQKGRAALSSTNRIRIRTLVHEVHAPVLVRSRRPWRLAAQQRYTLATLELHAQLQASRQYSLYTRFLFTYQPSRSSRDLNPQVAEPGPAHSNVTNALAQRTLVARGALAVPHRQLQHRQATRAVHADFESLLHPGCQLAQLGSLQRFF